MSLVIVRNDLNGLHLSGPSSDDNKVSICSKPVRCLEASDNGDYMVYCDSTTVYLWNFNDAKVQNRIELESVQFVALSPKCTKILAYKHTTNTEQKNLFLFDLKTGSLISEFRSKQNQWRLKWSADEKLCARQVNSEIFFYEGNNYEKFVKKFNAQKVADYDISTIKRNGQFCLACYSVGAKGAPNFIRLYKYPVFDNVIANKSFFRTDNVNFKWSPKGDAVLVLCVANHDETGKSYYGEQKLNYLDMSGKSFIVTLGKEGPIHSVEWYPGDEKPFFCVIYGFVPSKASFYNSNGVLLYDIGEISANQIIFNRFGSLMALAGFGNLSGQIFVFDTQKQKLIAKFSSSSSTYISWAPDGEHILTATTSPRMRVSNGYKVWHYTGDLKNEMTYQEEGALTTIFWRPLPVQNFKPPTIKEPKGKIELTVASEKPARYIPPALRKQMEAISGQPQPKQNTSPSGDGGGGKSSEPLSKESQLKQISKIKRILKEIDGLKAKQTSGVVLNKNQVEKIEKESRLLQELNQLKIK